MTPAAIGDDASSNNNQWTPVNMAIADAIDYGAKSVRGNYCTWNTLDKGSSITVQNAGLQVVFPQTGTPSIRGTIGVTSGKWYWEITPESNAGVDLIGIAKAEASLSTYVGGDANGWGYYGDGQKYTNNIASSYGASYLYANNDIIGVAFDADNGNIVFYKNNVSQGTAFTGLTSGPYFPAHGDGSNSFITSMQANFGQRPFAYTPPAGFKALCTHNLPAPAIKRPAQYMAATTYTGTGVGRTITNTVNNKSFQPDLVWIKGRSGATDHALYDSVRGATKDIASNSFGVETTQSTGLTAFGANGFDIGALAKLNTNAATYVAWQWKAGDGVVTNTAGSITSQVNANPTTGLSIVTYTGTGANATVGHGLGVTPSMVMVKNLTGTTSANWRVWHSSLAGVSYYLGLNQTTAAANSTSVFNGFSSTNFTIGTDPATNESGKPLVAYCFAEIAGYSKFGSYTGNGSADGPFVFCGFRPRFVMVKQTTGAGGNWFIVDTQRDLFNVEVSAIKPSSPDTETTSTAFCDILSSGFKLRHDGSFYSINIISQTYIFAAFAEVPSKYALAR